jgi:hypothetical protein
VDILETNDFLWYSDAEFTDVVSLDNRSLLLFNKLTKWLSNKRKFRYDHDLFFIYIRRTQKDIMTPDQLYSSILLLVNVWTPSCGLSRVERQLPPVSTLDPLTTATVVTPLVELLVELDCWPRAWSNCTTRLHIVSLRWAWLRFSQDSIQAMICQSVKHLGELVLVVDYFSIPGRIGTRSKQSEGQQELVTISAQERCQKGSQHLCHAIPFQHLHISVIATNIIA